MHVPIRLGLAGALALLAACGPTKPGGDLGNDEDGDGSEGDNDAGESAEGSDTGMPGAMCTVENYADDPQMLDFSGVDCFPAQPDGTCPGCYDACMQSIVPSCAIDGCGFPDLPCADGCAGHTLLCSEKLGDECCYLVTADWNGSVPGRPLREHGAPLLPALKVEGSGSSDARRAEAAATYREFARYEQASVDAFLHAAAVLEQLGAPEELLDDHRDAAREEAGHARLALAAAQALDGRVASLGPVPPNSHDFELASFVRDLIHDGCIGELVAAREAEWALAQPSVSEHEALVRYWRPVAEQEAGHAELAWRTLEWLLAAAPQLTAQIGRELAVATGSQPIPDGPAVDDFGLPAHATKARLRAIVIADLIAEARVGAAALT